MMTAAYNWTDRRRYLWLCGLIVPLSPFLGYAMVDRLGPGMFWAFGSMVMAVVLPVIDVLRGSDSTSCTDEERLVQSSASRRDLGKTSE